jgi:hypothetical protein
MIYKNRSQAVKETGISYLGSVNLTAKHVKAYKYNELTYSLYLAPADVSGYEVCPLRTKECTRACLHESGLNKIDVKANKINKSRIAKTKLFFENRNFFMEWMIDEIRVAKEKAARQEQKFSVRLNNTSDLSPEQFVLGDKNILEIFEDDQFFEYSKIYNRIKLAKKYKNYDLTFSYSGSNKEECLNALNVDNTRVAVVFKDKLPEKFWDFDVINGDEYDMRYYDPKNVVVGLKFKKVRNSIDFENNSFIN